MTSLLPRELARTPSPCSMRARLRSCSPKSSVRSLLSSKAITRLSLSPGALPPDFFMPLEAPNCTLSFPSARRASGRRSVFHARLKIFRPREAAAKPVGASLLDHHGNELAEQAIGRAFHTHRLKVGAAADELIPGAAAAVEKNVHDAARAGRVEGTSLFADQRLETIKP